jgi:hypothetical protein
VYLLAFHTFLLGILIFKGLTARHLYKLFGIKGLMATPIVRLLALFPIHIDCMAYVSLFSTANSVMVWMTVELGLNLWQE